MTQCVPAKITSGRGLGARAAVAALAALVALAFGAGAAFAGYAEGKAAFDKRDAATAWKELDPLAKQGNRDAQFLVGTMYHLGMGVAASYKDAAEWYRKSADGGKIDAIFTMGVVYEGGIGVPRNLAEAFAWYKKAADRGFYGGIAKVADMYGKGRGVKRDFAQAYFWYSVAERLAPAGSNDKYEIPIVRDRLASMITKEQVADADRKAKAWKPVASK